MNINNFDSIEFKAPIISLISLIISYINFNEFLSSIVLISSIVYTWYKIEDMKYNKSKRNKDKSKEEENDNNNNN